jgi:TetR/AcrR family transcriptional regulator, regulator of cefoperazone and chloramphenicol sensitivity
MALQEKVMAAAFGQEGNSCRDLLIEAAEKLFFECSYDAVSTRDIAEAAKVNLGSIQYHFGSKGELFLEAVRAMMRADQSHLKIAELTKSSIRTKKSAADLIARYIEDFLGHLLQPNAPRACKIFYRELLSEKTSDHQIYEKLLTLAVEEFIRPEDEALIRVLKKILPDTTPEDLMYFCWSLIGQCSFFITHEPFFIKICGKPCTDPKMFQKIVSHLVKFSLTGLGCSNKIIQDVLKQSNARVKNMIRMSNRRT